MIRYEIRFTVEAPDDMTWDEVLTWVAFDVGAKGEMKVTHPYMENDINVVPNTFRCRQE